MQAAMDITAKYCHKEMEAYGSCVASNPSTWQTKCHELKVKVAQCTSSHPVIQKIRQDCSREFVDFERCLRENPDKPTSCSSHVARFLGCAETVDLSGVGESFSCNSTCTTQGAIETINTHTHTGKETTQKKYQYSDFCTSYSKKTHWFSFLNSRLKFHNP
uniref:IMS import disulfide relay-system CHCH-CHCH-like Cx9C domain-containing protein n=1 Tax=Gasterosteus aculeatus aculeatus TaxID=481459 RepID=A0AAQ4RA19_GASAC